MRLGGEEWRKSGSLSDRVCASCAMGEHDCDGFHWAPVYEGGAWVRNERTSVRCSCGCGREPWPFPFAEESP